MLKKFNDNESYFRWFHKYSKQIKIQRIDTKEKVIVKYEKELRKSDNKQ